jgi:hypothetical protein
LIQPLTRDQAGIVVQSGNRSGGVILTALANYEDGLAQGAAVRRYDLASGQSEDTLPADNASAGPLALADVDGDGDLDLFVGGRVIPGRYPAPAPSRLFLSDGLRFTPDATSNPGLATVGMVSGAVFTDLDGDGFPELVLACEWGPVRVFRGRKGRDFREVTAELGLDRYVGWWNGVAAGDLNGDGRMDLVASNWGQNTRYEAYRSQPLRIYYGDLQSSGQTDLLEAYYEPNLNKIVPWQHLGRVAAALPFVRERFATFASFGEASVSEILGDRLAAAQELQAGWLQSTAFIQDGSRFSATPLPALAQLSPAFAVCIGDLDGDGSEDLFLSQNFFGTEAETGRYDSGYGLCLKGTGSGEFREVLPQSSGVRIYGEQRGAALCDFDEDGRLDLAVTQNAAETRLFRNVSAKPGLRVRLRGPPGNAAGIGAVVRVTAGGQQGGAKELHAGSGYWSQDSAVLVFATSLPPADLWVRWPGGKTHTASVPSGARSVLMDDQGHLQVVE